MLIFKDHISRLSSTLVAIIFALVLLSCSNGETNFQKELGVLPNAAGDNTEIVVVIDSIHWDGPVGDFVRNTLGAPIPGLPQDEPRFTLRRIEPLRMTNSLKVAKNIIYFTFLNDNSASGRFMRNNITEESLSRIQNEPDLFMLLKHDENAAGQEITHFFGTSESALLENLNKNRERIINHFIQLTKARIKNKMYAIGEEKNLSQEIANRHNFQIRIPAGYQIAKEEDNFVWIRLLDQIAGRSVFVYYTDYTTQDVFKQENLLALREKITSTHLRDIEKNDIYITYQPVLPMKSRATTFNENFAMESYGLWRLNDNTLGGPYRSYCFVDEELNRLYYMEGYIVAPGKDKKELLFEIEVIMETFKTLGKS